MNIIKYNLLIIMMAMLSGCTSLKKIFLDEVKKEIAKHTFSADDTITEADIVGLPIPVQRYFRHCGYIGTSKMSNAWIRWENVYLKMAPQKKWSKIACYQFNSVPAPARFDYMKSRFLGIIPFEGSHMYYNHHGSMRIVLSKMFTVVDGKGIEFDRSELVTILSEILFVPSYALQEYITWTPVDEVSAKATLTYDDITVSGIFVFNESGECIRFDTEDRYYDNHDGTYRKMKWSAVVKNYVLNNGVRQAGEVSAVWHTEKGDFEYFKGRIATIRSNITSPGPMKPADD